MLVTGDVVKPSSQFSEGGSVKNLSDVAAVIYMQSLVTKLLGLRQDSSLPAATLQPHLSLYTPAHHVLVCIHVLDSSFCAFTMTIHCIAAPQYFTYFIFTEAQ